MNKRSGELESAHRYISQDTAKIANRMARERLLMDTKHPDLAARLTVMSGRNLTTLKAEWNPFVADYSRGIGVKIRESDALLLSDLGLVELMDSGEILIGDTSDPMIMRLAHIGKARKEITEIINEAADEAIINNSERFVRTMMKDLFSPSSYYESTIEADRTGARPL